VLHAFGRFSAAREVVPFPTRFAFRSAKAMRHPKAIEERPKIKATQNPAAG